MGRGAGVDAVLDRDSDMAPYLFPKGTSLAEVRAVVDRYKTLNLKRTSRQHPDARVESVVTADSS